MTNKKVDLFLSHTGLPQAVNKNQRQLIVDLLFVANRMWSNTLGEMVGVRRLTNMPIDPEVLYYASWVADHPSVMQAEWAVLDDCGFLVLEKYFTNNSPYNITINKEWSMPGNDFYRLVGPAWSICFSVDSSKSRVQWGGLQDSFRLFGTSYCNVTIVANLTGRIHDIENDSALFKLMGYFE